MRRGKIIRTKLIATIFLLLSILGIAGGSDLDFGTEVLYSVFDNGEGIVYIKADDPRFDKPDETMVDIMNKEATWKRMFPDKIITASSVIACPTNFWATVSSVYGMHINYEIKAS